jgi:hypothetical protein
MTSKDLVSWLGRYTNIAIVFNLRIFHSTRKSVFKERPSDRMY